MAKERISASVGFKIKRRVKEAAEALGLSESKFVIQAIITDLEKLDIRIQTHEARRQRDHFKGKFETAQEELTAAGTKIDALEKRGLFARIFNRPPKI